VNNKCIYSKKCLKIPKGLSKAIHRKGTDNTIAKRTNNDLQNTKYLATQIPLKTEGQLSCPGRVNCFCSTCGPHSVTLATNPMISHELRRGPNFHYNKWNI